MATNILSDLAPFDNGNPLNYLEKNGEILFSAEEIGRGLGYAYPARSINNLYLQNQKELKHYSVNIRTVQTDGKSYATRAFSEEGVYIISMLSRTQNAKRFRAKVALLMRRWRREQQEKLVELAREAGQQQALEMSTKTASLVWSLGTKDKRAVRRTVRYRKLGLGATSIAKLLGVHKRAASQYIKAAIAMGLLDTPHGGEHA